MVSFGSWAALVRVMVGRLDLAPRSGRRHSSAVRSSRDRGDRHGTVPVSVRARGRSFRATPSHRDRPRGEGLLRTTKGRTMRGKDAIWGAARFRVFPALGSVALRSSPFRATAIQMKNVTGGR